MSMSSPLDGLCGPGGPLPHTLGLGPEVWRVLDRAHTVRNRSEYEGDMSVDERLLTDLIKACRTVLASLQRLPPI